ncbi:MAG: hemolysin III family protein [Bacteroidota bacterium]|jgi:hemolysin III|nr:hemolysin III family protein [Bacteroidota bacterium]
MLEILGHISIYFLIEGIYTPLLLIYRNNAFGITLLSVLGGLTVFGIFFKIFYTGCFEIISVIIYIAMGWILIAGGNFFYLIANGCFNFYYNMGRIIQYRYYFLFLGSFPWHLF